MPTILHLVDLVTSDALTLAATGILALAVLSLLVLIAWPSRGDRPTAARGRHAEQRAAAPRRAESRSGGQRQVARNARATTARSLAASGISTIDIARRTGLSRDALALLAGMSGLSSSAARQKAPSTARLSLFQRLRGASNRTLVGGQVTA